MSLTIKTEFKRSNGEVDIRRTRLIDGSDRYTQLITYLDSTYGTLYGINKSSYVLSYVDPDGDACSVNSDAELLECCRCATEQGKTAKIRVKLIDDMSLSTSSLALSMASSLMTPLSVSRDVSHTSNAVPSVSQPGFHQPSAPEVDSDSEYVQVDSAPSTPATPAVEIKVDAEPVAKSEPVVPSVTVEDVTDEDRDENALVEAIMASFTSPAEPAAAAAEKPNVVPSVFTTVSSTVEVQKEEESKVDSSSSDAQPVHAGIVCDGCNASPVLGDRFKCLICVDFDLCSKCENSGKSFGRHSAQHNMIKIAAPGQPIRPRCPALSESTGPSTGTSTGPSDVHAGVRCDGCSTAPIKGIRYKCTSCPNFDLCEDCEAKNFHDPKHVLLKMRHTVTGEDVQNAILNRVSHWWRRGGPHHVGSHGGHPHQHPHGHPHGHLHGGHRGGMGGMGRWGGRCGRGRDFAGTEDANRPRAAFISDVTLQDGATVAPLSTFQKVWSIQNVGTTAWPEGSKLIFVGGDLTSADQSGIPVEHTNDSVPVTAQPNEIVTVKIDIQAPEQEGRFRSTFRLVTPDGEKFGPRMWIDLNVQAVNSATVEARSEVAQPVANPAVEHKSVEPISTMPVAEPVHPQDSVRAAIQTIVGALGQQGGASPINSFLDLIQGHGRMTPRSESRASPVVAPSTTEVFHYQAELTSIREMGVDANDETLKTLLKRYNGSVPRTLSQIFEESN